MTISKAVLLLACLVSVALSATAAAQSGDGSLRGIVTDESGAVIPGAHGRKVAHPAVRLERDAGLGREVPGGLLIARLDRVRLAIVEDHEVIDAGEVIPAARIKTRSAGNGNQGGTRSANGSKI